MLRTKKAVIGMTKLGIDAIGFYTPGYCLALSDWALARGKDPNRYNSSWGQQAMSVPSVDEDVVSMAMDASSIALKDIDKDNVALLLFATETSVDAAKSAGMFVHNMLQLSPACRVLELKQACYAGTGGLMLGLTFLKAHPDKKVLLICSDIAKYPLGSAGEASGGAGSIAMVLSANPRILTIEPYSGVYAQDSMDFWRPTYKQVPLVNSRLSCNLYIKFLLNTFAAYCQKAQRSLNDIDHFCYHLSVPQLVHSAHKHLYRKLQGHAISKAVLDKHLKNSMRYGVRVGNIYTGSLYLSLLSLLDNSDGTVAEKRIGFYSYGSGSIGEFFSGTTVKGYHNVLRKDHNQNVLANRVQITVDTYEAWHNYLYPEDGTAVNLPVHKKKGCRLKGLASHKRIYEKA